jgi:hypothetical protein
MYGQVPIQTASTFGSATTLRQSAAARAMPNSFATFSEEARLRLHTTDSSTPSMARKPGMCIRRVFPPAPMKAIRRGCVMGIAIG